MEEAVKFLLAQLDPWKEEGPRHESWEVCQFCDGRPELDRKRGVYSLGHEEDCAYRVICEMLGVEMKGAYN